jgi:ABC-type transport system substrate-binding protein
MGLANKVLATRAMLMVCFQRGRGFKSMLRFAAALVLGMAMHWLLAETVNATPINSPHAEGAEQTNSLFTAFTQRSPKYLDPARSYSTDETPFTYNIYEPLYGYHYLKRPYELIARAAAQVVAPVYFSAQGHILEATAAPEDIAFSVYDIPIRRGVLFAPHPAFAREANGAYTYWPLPAEFLQDKYSLTDFTQTGTRELTAHDYVYAFRRLASPKVASPIYSTLAQHVVDFSEYGDRLRDRVKQQAQPQSTQPQSAQSPSNQPIVGALKDDWLDLRESGFEGVTALDDYTLRIRVKGPYPQFQYWLAMTFTAPIAWEVDRFYAQPDMAKHNLSINTWPAGTGPYMMVESIQNRRHVLAKNPNFRGEPYPCDGEPEDKAKGLLADCGKPTPFIDRIVFDLEKETIPLQGKFMQGYYDMPQVDRGDYGVAMIVAAGDSKEKAALYAQRGIQLPSTVEAQMQYLGFNWLDPVVGQGDTPEQQLKNRKLRQALSIAFNWEAYVSIFQNDQAQVAFGPVPPGILGYQPAPQGINRVVYDVVDNAPVRKSLDVARQLLTEAGYPNGRHAQTGAPLVLYFDSASGGGTNPTLEWMRRQFAQIGVQLDIRATDYNRFQEKMSRGVAQMFMWGWVADYPDAENFLFLLYGKQAKAQNGGENASNYQNAEYDKLFLSMRDLPDGPEKGVIIARMIEILQIDAPWMFGIFPKSAGAYQQWVGNAKPTQMVRNTLQFLSIDATLRHQKITEWNQPIWWPVIALLAFISLLVWPAWRMLRQQQVRTALGDAASTQVATRAVEPARDASTVDLPIMGSTQPKKSRDT